MQGPGSRGVPMPLSRPRRPRLPPRRSHLPAHMAVYSTSRTPPCVFIVVSVAIAIFSAALLFIITGLMNAASSAAGRSGRCTWRSTGSIRRCMSTSKSLPPTLVVAALAGHPHNDSARWRRGRGRDGPLLLQRLDFPRHQPAHARVADRPPAGAVAQLPRQRPDRRCHLPPSTRTALW